ncbi:MULTISPECIES: hypothetical protein [Bacillus]|uniref:hypothetical protein n=1 Tax=Bacillus TaxID=1386 RepID=UPI000C763EC5|nr:MULTISPECIES: hypothetical protein [Bacillus]MCP1161245.1 hypothetical protein [Bacillus infantis]PLR70566.1 hypothetical protein CYJ37_23845 [Bacillus sp. UMB0728]
MELDKYPATKKLIEEAKLENDIDRIKWLQLSKEEAAVSIAKLYYVSLLSTSNNKFLHQKAKKFSDQLYFSVGYKLHGFAKAQANDELNCDFDDVARIYKHISFSGIKYRQKSVKDQ